MMLLFIDLDEFKSINEVLGMTVGDTILRETAERLSGLLNPEDTIARLGSDEFAMILTKMKDSDHVAWVIDKIRSASAQPLSINNNTVLLLPVLV